MVTSVEGVFVPAPWGVVCFGILVLSRPCVAHGIYGITHPCAMDGITHARAADGMDMPLYGRYLY